MRWVPTNGISTSAASIVPSSEPIVEIGIQASGDLARVLDVGDREPDRPRRAGAERAPPGSRSRTGPRTASRRRRRPRSRRARRRQTSKNGLATNGITASSTAAPQHHREAEAAQVRAAVAEHCRRASSRSRARPGRRRSCSPRRSSRRRRTAPSAAPRRSRRRGCRDARPRTRDVEVAVSPEAAHAGSSHARAAGEDPLAQALALAGLDRARRPRRIELEAVATRRARAAPASRRCGGRRERRAR